MLKTACANHACATILMKGQEGIKHSTRRAKTDSVAMRRLKKFRKSWYPVVDKTTTWLDPDKNLALIKGKFKKHNGTCNSKMCKHPRYEREKQRKENRKEVEDQGPLV